MYLLGKKTLRRYSEQHDRCTVLWWVVQTQSFGFDSVPEWLFSIWLWLKIVQSNFLDFKAEYMAIYGVRCPKEHPNHNWLIVFINIFSAYLFQLSFWAGFFRTT